MYNDFTVMNHNGFRDFHVGGDSVYLEADLIDRRIAPFSNEYNYANQNPTNTRDRFGLFIVSTRGYRRCPYRRLCGLRSTGKEHH